nr:Maf family protein [Micromonospora sp. DSM 115978]
MRTTGRPRLILASASPARLKLLRSAGFTPEVIVSGVDEEAITATRAAELCLTLAQLKADAVVDRVRTTANGSTGDGSTGDGTSGGSTGGRTGGTTGGRTGDGGTDNGAGVLVLGCDSVLEFDGEILGKPADAQEARRRWRRMGGRSGVLHTGHSLVDVSTGGRADAVTTTVVHFAVISDTELAGYLATGEPYQVAGAFTIDGFGGPFVERVEGDHGTVIGVSLPRLRGMLGELGFQVTDLWATRDG